MDSKSPSIFWTPATRELTVWVCDRRRRAYSVIRPESHLALDVFYHPYSYVSTSDVQYVDERLAA
jgi:hypothetical protein